MRKSEIDLPKQPKIRDLGLKGYHFWAFWLAICLIARFFFLPPQLRQFSDTPIPKVPLRILVIYDRFCDVMLIFLLIGLIGFALSWLKQTIVRREG